MPGKAAADLRAQPLEQFNRVLETRDTRAAFVVSHGRRPLDFENMTFGLEAREKLAKLSGIILAHPGLNLAVEGHTDAVVFPQSMTSIRNFPLNSKRGIGIKATSSG